MGQKSACYHMFRRRQSIGGSGGFAVMQFSSICFYSKYLLRKKKLLKFTMEIAKRYLFSSVKLDRDSCVLSGVRVGRARNCSYPCPDCPLFPGRILWNRSSPPVLRLLELCLPDLISSSLVPFIISYFY